MFQRIFIKFLFFAILLPVLACQKSNVQTPTVAPTSLRDVPALRLNYRFEADVPAPEQANQTVQMEERNGLVQGDFDQNRPQEILDMTVTSPDKQKVLAVYHNVSDMPSEFRLDMYGADGKVLKTITHDGMAVHFPDTIVWSPDSTSVAFVAMARLGKLSGLVPDSEDEKSGEATPVPTVEANTETDANANTDTANVDPNAEATPATDKAAPVLTFRTEQIYICDSNGNDLKPLTQNEGLIYFYFVWSPDSSALAALASRATDWRIFQYQANQMGEKFRPAGRPRVVEKNGRQRLLDDRQTQVHPVWSPDSAKIASAFDKQIGIYDATGDAPTQAAIMLRNQLLISSKTYDDLKKAEASANGETEANAETNASVNANKTANNNANSNANAAVNLPEGVLPDESTLVSFNPIVKLFWTEETMLYFETAYIKEFADSTNNVRSNARWHRLVLSPQAIAVGN